MYVSNKRIFENSKFILVLSAIKYCNVYLLQNGEIVDLILVDFQLINCGSPAADLIYFIFSGSDKKIRKSHLKHFKDLYYDTFEKYLKCFGINADDVYTKENFEKDFQEHLNYGLTSCLMLMPFLFSEDDDVPDLQAGVTDLEFHWNDKSKKRWQDMVEDFIQWKQL
jgi:hypothetical protein